MKPEVPSPTGLVHTRRRFLRRTLVLPGLPALFPALVPSSVLGAEGRSGPNDQIGVGVIGMGRQAGDLLRILAGLREARLAGFADVNLPRAQAAAETHGGSAVQDYRRLLEQKDVDAIITATPEHWRILVCLDACEAGKDLYVEKPVSLTVREGRWIANAVRKHRRVFQTGSQQRSMWPNYAGCAFIRGGGLGKLERVIAHNYPTPWEHALPAQPVPEGLDWDRWCGPTEPVPFNQDLYLPRANPGWLSFRPYSGGEMTGWGSHGFDQVQWALGMDHAGPEAIWTEGGKLEPLRYEAAEPKTRGDEWCRKPRVFFRYARGIVMELSDGGPPGGAIFIGSKGKVTLDRGFFKSDPPELAEEALSKKPRDFNPIHLRNWLECIRSRKDPVAHAEIGHRSATVCHLGNIARWIGRRLEWDPVKEEFPGDAEANALLDRPRRKGFDVAGRV